MSFIGSNIISLSCLSCFLAPPSIDYTDPPLESATKENVTLTCHVSGLPEPTFTWITPDGTLVNATAPVRKVAEKLDDDSANGCNIVGQQVLALLGAVASVCT